MLDTKPHTAFKVEDFLKNISYKPDPAYVPSAFALEFVNFIKLVEGGDPENKTPVVHYKMVDEFVAENDLDTLNMCHRGIAKALSLDTRLPTPEGWSTVAGIVPGQKVFDEHGKPVTVLAKSKVFNRTMYKLVLGDGRELKVSEDHINTVIHRRQKRINGKRVSYLDRRNLTTKELLGTPLFATRSTSDKNPKGRENRVWIPFTRPVLYPAQDLPVDPYTLGLVLGDGGLDRITGFYHLYAHKADMPFYLTQIPTPCSPVLGKVDDPNAARIGLLGLGSLFRELGVNTHGNDKKVPEQYKLGSVSQRLSLLQGLMDTDGTVYKNGCCSFTSNSRQLADDVQELIFSLGGSANVSPMNAAWRVNISCNQPLFRLPRKASRQHRKCLERIPVIAIEPIPTESSQCLMVDSVERTFLAGDYVVTHNSTLKEYLLLYLGTFGVLPGFGRVPYALYVSDSIENGVKKMRKALEYRWDNSDFLKRYIPTIRFTDMRWEFQNSDGLVFITSGYGAKTGVRGTRENGTRPVLALLDDLISDADARSATVIADVEDTVYKAIDYALHPKRRKIIWSGTPFNSKDPLYKAVESGAWNVNVYPVCERFPCSREDFRGSWEDRFDYDYVLRQYQKAVKSGRVDTFNQELMLRIMSDEDRLIQDHDINWYKRSTILANRAKFNFYITTDFATSTTESADFSVISVWAYSNRGDWFWVDGICKRQLMDATIDDLFRLAQEYNPQQVGIEVSGQQKGFIAWIRNEMLSRNIYFPLASEGNDNQPGIRPNTDKMTRFNTIVPWFKLSRMFFPIELKNSPALIEAYEELSLVSPAGFKSKHDDFCDTISMLASLTPWKPSADSGKQKSRENDLWEFDEEEESGKIASYLV